jgi:hypothetical protein
MHIVMNHWFWRVFFVQKLLPMPSCIKQKLHKLLQIRARTGRRLQSIGPDCRRLQSACRTMHEQVPTLQFASTCPRSPMASICWTTRFEIKQKLHESLQIRARTGCDEVGSTYVLLGHLLGWYSRPPRMQTPNKRRWPWGSKRQGVAESVDDHVAGLLDRLHQHIAIDVGCGD